jgi:PmbA protein
VKEEEGVAIRGIKDNRMTFAYTYDQGEKAAGSLVRNLTQLIPFAVYDEDLDLPRRYERYPAADLYDHKGAGDSEKKEMLFNMEKAMLDHDRRIVATRNCELHEVEIETMILNSRGLIAEGKKTLYVLNGLCVAKDEDEVSWYDWAWSHHWREMDGEKLGRSIAERTISFLSGRQLATGTYEGIITPQASCDLLSILSSSFLAENLHKNKTCLKDRVGEKCFADVISIVDSGLTGMGSFYFDGEGVPAQENVVVKNGSFRGFLYDSYYGKKLKKPSTGNGTRTGIKEPPKCGPRGVSIEQGVTDIRSSFTNGVVIEELMGTHTANPVTGDFSLGAIGHLYKGGTSMPFKGIIFSGNIFQLLNNVKAVGTDMMFYGSYGSPSLFVEDIKISGI